ncbi:hypothetical protein [Methanobrevibacter arboriphilus]|nr:hypothetical protein [Methanobrevibacter arboriphilus]
MSIKYYNHKMEMINILNGIDVGNNYNYVYGDIIYSFKLFLGQNNEYIDEIINIVGEGNKL